MKRILLIILIFMLLIPSVSAENVTIKGVTFEIPSHYSGGTSNDNSYVYESGYTFRILVLDNYKNLKFNYGSDMLEGNMINSSQNKIAGHDAVIINGHYKDKNYTTIYLAIGDKIFLICFNDTYVNDDIVKMIESTPPQTMSHEDFVGKLNNALKEYQSDLNNEKERYLSQQNNKPQRNIFLFIWR